MIRKTLPAVLCLAIALITAHAQSNYAVVRGSILDPQRRPVVAAHIRITSAGTGAEREVVSNATGLYEIAGLQPGAYSLTVDSPGFQQTKQTIDLEVGQQATLDLLLSLGSDNQTVMVHASSELLKTQDASVGEVVDQRSVDSLPLNGRMLIDLVLTVPGAHISHGASTGDMNSLYWRPGQRSAVSIGGSRPNANYFLLDGATNTDPTFSTQNLSPSPDAVQEFQVQTGSYSAEMGGAGGGQINIVTRSGSSQFHGTAYEFLRNGAMDAHSFNQMGGSNFLVQNNFGASLGGPIKHAGKTFFFTNYEALRHVEVDAMVGTVPTPEEASGDFSQSGVDIYDPSTTAANPSYNPSLPVSKSNPQYIRQQFEYNGVKNVIPPTSITHAASIMLDKYTPQPNAMDMGGMTMMGQPTVVGAGNDANNFLDTRKERMTDDQGTIRVDHSFANGDTAFLRYSAASEYGFMPEGLPGFGLYHDNFSQQGILAWTHVFSPHTVNIASAAISRLVMMHTTESANKNDIVDELGITGTGFGGPAAWGAPYFNIQGFSPLGDNYLATPMHAWDTVIEGRDSLNWQVGRHSAKFGGAYQRFIWPMWGFFQNRSYYQYTNGYTTQYALNGGATPVCVVSSPEKAAICQSMGAELIIDRSAEEYRFWKDGKQQPSEWKRLGKKIRQLTGGEDPDIVFEHPGRDTFGASVYVTKRGGTIVTCASTTGYWHEYDNRYLWMTLKRIVGSHFANYRESWEANRLIGRGAIHPTLSRVYSLEDTGQAAFDVHRNRHQGKVGVLCLAPTEGLGVRDSALRAQHLEAINRFRGV